MKNKYKKLVNNSLIFAIGNFGSKIMSFIMVPIYSYTLTTNDYGKVDLLTSLVSLLMPVICLDIYDSVFRFALDRSKNKSQIFSTGMIFAFISSILAIILGIVISQFINSYPVMYTVIYMIVSVFYSLISNFARAIGYVKQFAMAGIVNTFIMGGCNILFLIVIKMGMNGYMLSMILGQGVAILFLILTTKIFIYFGIRNLNNSILKKMLIYGVPLIPNNLAWWLNSASDRFFILVMIGASANGIYAMANKIPSIITTVSSIFFQSWQISVVEEYEKEDGKTFISSVFESYLSILFFLGVGILAVIRPLYRIILSPSYFIGWKLTPFLVLAVIYTSLASFLGTIYTANKKTVSVLVTTIYGAIANVILTIILVKFIGIDGAAIANAISFFLVSLLRFIEIKRMKKIDINEFKFVLLHLIFICITVSLLILKNNGVVLAIGIVLLTVQLLFDKDLKNMFKHLKSFKIKRRKN